jgi:glutamine synthetase
VPAEDRNRTSPFPYGGHRFEFRAVGSSQNPAWVNTILNSAVADAFARFADAIEGGRAPREVAGEALGASWRAIFNGDGYSAEWRAEAERRGVWRIDSGVEALDRLGADKNAALFERLGVLSRAETEARRAVLLAHYAGTVEMEAAVMVDMIAQHVAPAVKAAGQDAAPLAAAAESVAAKLAAVHGEADALRRAALARELRLETMAAARGVVDEAEARCPADRWPLATYAELLFLDANQDAYGRTVRSA